MWSVPLVLLAIVGASPSIDGGSPMDVAEAMRLYNAASERPLPALSKRELRTLKAGRVVRRYIPPAKPGAAAGVLGVMVADVPQEILWLTIRDGHLAVSDGLTERRISGRYDQPDQVWFGMLKLPSPFHARHWRIHTHTDMDLARKTRGRAWESTWVRVKGGAQKNRDDAAANKLAGVSTATLDKAVYTLENHGSWLVIKLDERRTLLVYRAAADLGGVIPREIVSGFAHMRLGQLLRSTVKQVALVPPHYVGGHEPILRGDGRSVPLYGE